MPIIEQEFMELTRGLDVEAFWEENDQCQVFTTDKPRCSVSFAPDDHWIFEFMAVQSTLRYYQDKAYRDELHREVNRVTKEHVGKTFFDEDTPARLIELVKPDVLVKGGDWTVDKIVGADFVQARGGRVESLPLVQDEATTAIIEKIISVYGT